ncbi:hypothetical protein Y032_0001g73 [Ancylostoma ceylanicum]|uniref:BPTI/Kunitz inhibitor domain-containing protein n=1 Tax=Ancylostoma ceylanicum TaxID=53326 RepID=A0A016W4S7_9BILA|nr:hypothetical protein Y032_0001g73 [Ancylostoma ceylanicum]
MKVLLVLLFCIVICDARSVPHYITDEERCSARLPSGFICANVFKGFTFNVKTKKCEPFTTNLCKKPLNAFATLEECKKRNLLKD